ELDEAGGSHARGKSSNDHRTVFEHDRGKVRPAMPRHLQVITAFRDQWNGIDEGLQQLSRPGSGGDEHEIRGQSFAIIEQHRRPGISMFDGERGTPHYFYAMR